MTTQQDYLDIVHQLSRTMLSTDINEVFKRALRIVADAINAREGALLLMETGTSELYVRTMLSETAKGDEIRVLPVAKHLMTVEERGLLLADVQQMDFWKDKSARWHGVLGVQLLTEDTLDGELLGAIVFLSDKHEHFTEAQQQLVTITANMLTLVINNAELYKLIRAQAERIGSLLIRQQMENTARNE